QGPNLRVGAYIPAILCSQRYTGSVSETGHLVCILVALFHEDAAAVRQPPLHPRDQVSAALLQPVVQALVLQGVVEIQGGAICHQLVRAGLAARPEISIGNFRLEPQPVVESIGAAGTDAAVVLAIFRL